MVLLMLTLGVSAQVDRSLVRNGNHAYRNKQWKVAETAYRKALAANSNNSQAAYNLGCALMQLKQDSAALASFLASGKMETNKIRAAKSFHNIGVIFQAHQDYAKAIDAYKMALRKNPDDNQTRYNLALCQKLLKNQPNKNKDDNKKQKQKKEKQKKEQKEQEQKNKEQDKQQQQKDQQKMSKDNAEQLLNAAIQQEKATKQRIRQNMQAPKRKSLEQNW